MPRKPATTAAASGPTPRNASKRSATDIDTPPPTRHSKRARPAASRKSYAEPTTDTDGENGADSAAEASDYEEDGGANPQSASSPSDQDDEDDEDASDDDTTPKRRPGKTAQRKSQAKAKNSATTTTTTTTPSWKQGAKLTPGTQLIIKKPRARDAGDTPYSDSKIHPNTMLFLGELAENNNRPWLKREC
jgi:hypothetical protein